MIEPQGQGVVDLTGGGASFAAQASGSVSGSQSGPSDLTGNLTEPDYAPFDAEAEYQALLNTPFDDRRVGPQDVPPSAAAEREYESLLADYDREPSWAEGFVRNRGLHAIEAKALRALGLNEALDIPDWLLDEAEKKGRYQGAIESAFSSQLLDLLGTALRAPQANIAAAVDLADAAGLTSRQKAKLREREGAAIKTLWTDRLAEVGRQLSEAADAAPYDPQYSEGLLAKTAGVVGSSVPFIAANLIGGPLLGGALGVGVQTTAMRETALENEGTRQQRILMTFAGVPLGLLDSAGESLIVGAAKKVMKEGGKKAAEGFVSDVLKTAGKEYVKGGSLETLTEGLQNVGERWATGVIMPGVEAGMSAGEFAREQALPTFLGGGLLSGAAGAVGRADRRLSDELAARPKPARTRQTRPERFSQTVEGIRSKTGREATVAADLSPQEQALVELGRRVGVDVGIGEWDDLTVPAAIVGDKVLLNRRKAGSADRVRSVLRAYVFHEARHGLRRNFGAQGEALFQDLEQAQSDLLAEERGVARADYIGALQARGETVVGDVTPEGTPLDEEAGARLDEKLSAFLDLALDHPELLTRALTKQPGLAVSLLNGLRRLVSKFPGIDLKPIDPAMRELERIAAQYGLDSTMPAREAAVYALRWKEAFDQLQGQIDARFAEAERVAPEPSSQPSSEVSSLPDSASGRTEGSADSQSGSAARREQAATERRKAEIVRVTADQLSKAAAQQTHYQGNKAAFFNANAEAVARFLTESAANAETVFDMYAGGGTYGLTLASAAQAMPKLRRVVINEIDAGKRNRLEVSMRLGAKALDRWTTDPSFLQLKADLAPLIGASTTPARTAMEALSGRSASALYKPFLERWGAWYDALDSEGRAAFDMLYEVTFSGRTADWDRLLENATADALRVKYWADKAEQRGVAVEIVSLDATSEEAIALVNSAGPSLVVLDPPYHSTSSATYAGGSSGLAMSSARFLSKNVAAAWRMAQGNALIYNNSETPEVSATLRSEFGDALKLSVWSRGKNTEVLGLFDGRIQGGDAGVEGGQQGVGTNAGAAGAGQSTAVAGASRGDAGGQVVARSTGDPSSAWGDAFVAGLADKTTPTPRKTIREQMAERRALALDGYLGFKNWVRAMGGLSASKSGDVSSEVWEGYSNREAGEGAKWGLGPLVHGKRSDKGMSLDGLLESAMEAGFLPQGSGIQEVLELLESDVTPQSAQYDAERAMEEEAEEFERQFQAELKAKGYAPTTTLEQFELAESFLDDDAPPFALSGPGAQFAAAYHGTPNEHRPEALVELPDGRRDYVLATEIPEGARVLKTYALGRFRLDKIGTGEGAQAYGWGLYFASNREVAEHYRNTLTRNADYGAAFGEELFEVLSESGIVVGGKVPFGTNSSLYSKDMLADGFLSGRLSPLAVSASLRKQVESRLGAKRGRLYEVDLAPAEDEYLLWDKPLSEQSDTVKAALANLPNPSPGALMDWDRGHRAYLRSRGLPDNGPPVRSMRDVIREMERVPTRGGTLYGALTTLTMDSADAGTDQANDPQKAASLALRAAGIRGIKYLDGSSRGAGEGNYNYVIFDEADVTVKARFAVDRTRIEAATAKAAKEGERTQVGSKPNPIANTSDDPKKRALQRGVREVWSEGHDPISRKAQLERAEKALADDYAGEKRRLFEMTARGETPQAHEQLELDLIKQRESERYLAGAADDTQAFEDAVEAAYSYMDARRAAARALGVIRDAYVGMRTGRQRFSDLVTTLSPDIRRRMEAARRKLKDPLVSEPGKAQVRAEIKRLLGVEARRVHKARAKLVEAGLNPTWVTADYFKDPLAFSRMARIVAAAKSPARDWVIEYFLASVLSGPLTHAANITGNVVNAGVNQHVQRFAEALTNLAIKEADGATFEEIGAFYRSFMPGLVQASRNFMLAMKTELPVLEWGLQARGLDVEGFGNKIDALSAPAIPGAVGRILRAPSLTLLLAADEFAKTLTSWTEAHALAWREATKEGLTGEEREQRMRDLIDGLDPKIWNKSLAISQKLAFQAKPGRFIQGMLDIRRAVDDKAKIPFGTLLFPFVNTPSRIFQEAIGLPVHPLRTLMRLVNGKYTGPLADKPQAVEDAARSAIAIAVMLALWGLVEAEDDEGRPVITGTMAYRPGQTDLAKRTNPPTSIRVGDQWFDYNRVEPVGTTVGVLVAAAQTAKDASARGDSEGVVAGLKTLGTGVLESLSSKTFLQTIGDLWEIAAAPDRADAKALKMGTRVFLDPLVPNIIRQTARSTDEMVRTSTVRKYDDMATWQAALAAQQYRSLPIAANAPPPKYDLWGRPIQKSSSYLLERLISPVQRSGGAIDVSDLDKLIVAYNRRVDRGEIPDGDKQYFRTIDYTFTHNGRTYYMSDTEYENAQRIAGQRAAERLMQRSARLNFDTPGPRDMELLNDELTAARAYARKQVIKDRIERGQL